MSNPTNHPGTDNLAGGNIYQESANLTEKKDAYKASQKKIAPQTYREENLPLYNFAKWYKTVFPVISLGLIISLAYMLTDLPETVEKFGVIGQIFNKVSLLVVLAVFGLNELVKTKSLSKFYKAKATEREIKPRTKKAAISASLISVLASAIGGFLLTFNSVDKTAEIKLKTDAKIELAESEAKTEVKEIKAEYAELIKAKRATKEAYQPPKKYRSLRAKIDKQIEGLVNERDNKIAALEAGKNSNISTISASSDTGTEETQAEALKLGIIVFVIAILLESANFWSNSFYWVYHTKTSNEGVLFAGLEKPSNKTITELQFIRLNRLLHSNNLGSDFISLPSANESIGEQAAPEKKKGIGFRQGYKTKPEPSELPPSREFNRSELEDIIRDILGSMTLGKGPEYLYRFFNKEDAKASRKKRTAKANKKKEKAIELRAAGKSVSQIARIIGRSERQVKRYFPKEESKG